MLLLSLTLQTRFQIFRTMSTLNLQTLKTKTPYEQFQSWHIEASGDKRLDYVQTNVMNLATASAKGLPSNRMVMLKKFDQDGFLFLTSYSSRKAEDLDSNPLAGATFYWHPLQRQVRIEGRVERLSVEEGTKYFYARPVLQQIGILSSDSRSVISDGEAFEEGIGAMKEEFGDGFNPVPKPDYAGGYRLIPSVVEFHQGYKDSAMGATWERFRFTMDDNLGENKWVVERISP